MPAAPRYVKVITTTTEGGMDRDKLTANESGANELPAAATLLVSMEQAMLLAQHEAKSKIHIFFVCRDDTKIAQKFLNAQDEYLKKNTMLEAEVIPREQDDRYMGIARFWQDSPFRKTRSENLQQKKIDCPAFPSRS